MSNTPLSLSFRAAGPCGTRPGDDSHHKMVCSPSGRIGNALHACLPELDIDHFKNYNDTFSHPSGDKALQAVARCIQDGRRGADVAARYGGEEFVLILPDTETEGALAVVGKIRTALTRISNLERPVTLSIGITLAQGRTNEPDMIVHQADQALYEAKRTGRDRICIFAPKDSV